MIPDQMTFIADKVEIVADRATVVLRRIDRPASGPPWDFLRGDLVIEVREPDGSLASVPGTRFVLTLSTLGLR